MGIVIVFQKRIRSLVSNTTGSCKMRFSKLPCLQCKLPCMFNKDQLGWTMSGIYNNHPCPGALPLESSDLMTINPWLPSIIYYIGLDRSQSSMQPQLMLLAGVSSIHSCFGYWFSSLVLVHLRKFC